MAANPSFNFLYSLTNVNSVIKGNGIDQGGEGEEWGSGDGETKGSKDTIPSSVDVGNKAWQLGEMVWVLAMFASKGIEMVLKIDARRDEADPWTIVGIGWEAVSKDAFGNVFGC